MTPEMSHKITYWRQRQADGLMTLEDYREAIRLMRQDRKAAETSGATSKRAKAKAVIPAADDMLSELEDL